MFLCILVHTVSIAGVFFLMVINFLFVSAHAWVSRFWYELIITDDSNNGTELVERMPIHVR